MTRRGRRLRVLWLVKGLGRGGAEQLLVSAARVGDHERFAYEAAFVVPWKDAQVPRLAAAGVPAHCIGRGRRGGVLWPWRLRRLLRSGRYDVVHLHSPLVAGVARVVARTTGRHRPVLVTTEHNAWGSYVLPTRLANAALFRADDVRFAVSDRVLASIPAPLRRGTATLVHGIVLDDIRTDGSARARIRAELGVSDDEVLICTVANYRVQKAYPDLLQAARQVVDVVPRARFVAVGQGPLEELVRTTHAELGLGDRFVLAGRRDDVMDILAAADVFALASHVEGFPIALMEAMAAGVPAVATDVGGVPDAVVDGQTGLIVPAGQPARLAEALLRVVRDADLRHRLAAGARQRGSEFDVRDAVRTVEAAYDRAVTARAVRRG